MARKEFPSRRQGTSITLTHKTGETVQRFGVTFNPDPDPKSESYGLTKEVFCLGSKVGSSLQNMIHKSCIAISVGLQHGATLEEYVTAFGIRDASRQPDDIIGRIVRVGAALDRRDFDLVLRESKHVDPILNGAP